MGVIAEMADDVVVMYLGREVEKGPVDEIFHSPQHPYTRALLRSIPSIMASAAQRAGDASAASIPHPYNRPAGCPFHPRCPEFMPGICDRAFPAAAARRPRHEVSCFLYRPMDGRGRGRLTHGPTILEVEQLQKCFPIRRGLLRRVVGNVRAVDDVSFHIRQGETLCAGRRERLRQDHDLALHPARAGADRRARSAFAPRTARRSIVATLPKARAAAAPPPDADDLPGPVLVAQSAHDDLDIVGEPLLVNGMRERPAAARAGARAAGHGAAARAVHATASRMPSSGGQRQRIGIARALALNPSADRGRRAGLGARRLGAGADRQPDARPAGPARPHLPVRRARSLAW